EITRLAVRSPVQSARKVLVLVDFHLVAEAGPALLKTIEEPPASTVFVILAEHVPSELVTIASRCCRVDFGPLAPERVAAALEAEGVPPETAHEPAARIWKTASAGRNAGCGRTNSGRAWPRCRRSTATAWPPAAPPPAPPSPPSSPSAPPTRPSSATPTRRSSCRHSSSN